MYCSNCGTQISDNSKFCENCGAPIADVPVQQPAQPAPLPHKQPPLPKMNGCLMALLIGLGVVGSIVLLVAAISAPGDTLIFLLVAVLPVLLFFGLKKPAQILRWCKEPTQLKVVRWWAGASIAILVIAIDIDTDFIYFLIVVPLVMVILGLWNPALILHRSKEPTRLKAAGWWAGAFVVVLAVAIGINAAITNDNARQIAAERQREFNWSLADDGTLTISGMCPMPDFKRSSTPWNEVEDDIKKVVIASGITSIGNNAFRSCTVLTSVTIPNTVIEIGEFAFGSCFGLTSVTIPNSVTKIEEGAFFECGSLRSITIPNTVTEIGADAFGQCSSLTSVTIPNSVTTIGDRAFPYQTALNGGTSEAMATVKKEQAVRAKIAADDAAMFGVGTWVATYVNRGGIRIDMTLTLNNYGTVYSIEKHYQPHQIVTIEENGTWTLKRESHHDVDYQWIEIRGGVYHDVDMEGNKYFPKYINGENTDKPMWMCIRDGNAEYRFTRQ